MAKKFFYVCAGLLCLGISYHFGARNAGAQSPGIVAGFSGGTGSECSGTFYVLMNNGDVYGRRLSTTCDVSGPLNLLGNFWNGPVPVQHETLGQVKTRYR